MLDSKQWWEPHPLDLYDQWELLEIAESTCAPKQNNAWYGDVEILAKDGWRVVFYYDCGELDYIDCFIMPDGTILDVWPNGYESEQSPPVMAWRGEGDIDRLRMFCA